MHDLRLPLADDARQLPRRRQVDLVARRQRHEVGPFERAAIELALAVRDEHGPVAHGAQPENGQEDLVLSAAPGAGGVDVESEHSSHELRELRPDVSTRSSPKSISPGMPSRKPPRRM